MSAVLPIILSNSNVAAVGQTVRLHADRQSARAAVSNPLLPPEWLRAARDNLEYSRKVLCDIVRQ